MPRPRKYSKAEVEGITTKVLMSGKYEIRFTELVTAADCAESSSPLWSLREAILDELLELEIDSELEKARRFVRGLTS